MKRNLSALLTVILLLVFFSPVCGTLFQCGCTYLWSGSDRHCRVQECPWCHAGHDSGLTVRTILHGLPPALMCVAAILVIRLIKRSGIKNLFVDVAAGLAAGLAVAVVVSLLYRLLPIS